MAKVKRGGLGKGLDSLIPFDVEEMNVISHKSRKSAETNEKSSENTVSEGIKNEAVESSEKTGSVGNTGRTVRKTTTAAAKNNENTAKTGTSVEKKVDGAETQDAQTAQDEVKIDAMVRLSLVEPNRSQPRKQFEEESLKELAESIRQYGVIQPLIVRKVKDHYEIVAGERRWRAAKIAGLKEVPVLIREYEDRQASEIALIENLQRKDLNPMEEAMAYRALMEEYGLKQGEVAEKVSKSRTVITNALRLLKLEPSVQKMVEEGTLSTGHAKVLLGLIDLDNQVVAAEQILEQGLSVRDTEKLVKKMNQPKREKEPVELSNQAIYQELETKMKNRVGTKVQIKRKNEKAGKIEIEYYSTEDLERISELLGI